MQQGAHLYDTAVLLTHAHEITPRTHETAVVSRGANTCTRDYAAYTRHCSSISGCGLKAQDSMGKASKHSACLETHCCTPTVLLGRVREQQGINRHTHNRKYESLLSQRFCERFANERIQARRQVYLNSSSELHTSYRTCLIAVSTPPRTVGMATPLGEAGSLGPTQQTLSSWFPFPGLNSWILISMIPGSIFYFFGSETI